MRSQKSKSNAIGRCSSSGVFFLSLSAPTGTRSLPVPARFSSRLRGPDKNTSSSLSRSTQKGQEPSGRRGAAVGAGIDQKKREKKTPGFFSTCSLALALASLPTPIDGPRRRAGPAAPAGAPRRERGRLRVRFVLARLERRRGLAGKPRSGVENGRGIDGDDDAGGGGTAFDDLPRCCPLALVRLLLLRRRFCSRSRSRCSEETPDQALRSAGEQHPGRYPV